MEDGAVHSKAGSPGADMQGTARSWRGPASLGQAPGTLQGGPMTRQLVKAGCGDGP